ncbi:beta-carotene 15,15'-monooxygenase [Winogradskyella sp.]|uniref:beta-carotene 15,15'-monooxygenase n=1 Tax=Winogradskyella sp. TaxID=1883156 RepID=UPI003BAD3D3C
MLKKLKELATLKEDLPKTEKSLSEETPMHERKRTYRDAGYKDSEDNHGNPTALKIHLDAVYAKFQNEEKENKKKQEALNEPYRKEKAEKETLIKTSNVLLENLKEKKEARVKKIEVIKYEIADLPNNPEKYGIEAKKGASVKFWIGLGLLLPITVYLLTFYISTSYSAFFKQFEIGASRINAVLAPEAFTRAWSESVLEGLFVTFIPFVFMGLGYLIHMFGEKKSGTNFFKTIILFFITFVFDAILAYQIEEKLYNLNKTLNSPNFDLSIAFQKIEFWGIIFAGFIVYIIWGLVFDFIMKEHKERDKIKLAITERKSKLEIEQNAFDEHEAAMHQLEEDIVKYQGNINELNRLIDAVIIPVKEYNLFASEYMQGWITAISSLVGKKERKQELIKNSSTIYESHLEEVGSSGQFQNKLYVANY